MNDTIVSCVDFLHFAWRTEGTIRSAAKTVRAMVGGDKDALRQIDAELNKRIPALYRVPTGNTRNMLTGN